MGQTADVVAGVAVVVRVAPEWRVEAELAALLDRLHVLVHGVHGLQDAAAHLLELAKLRWLLNAVVLQVVGI